MADCAPWDGPATTVYLTAAPGDSLRMPAPFLRLTVYRRVSGLPGSRFEWPAREQVAAGNRCMTEESCEVAGSGQIRFHAGQSDSLLAGEFELHFSDGSVEQGRFRAIWVARRILCG
jgi:hypothetical protein